MSETLNQDTPPEGYRHVMGYRMLVQEGDLLWYDISKEWKPADPRAIGRKAGDFYAVVRKIS